MVPSTQLMLVLPPVRPTTSGLMGATVIVHDPMLAPVLSGTHLPTLEEWKTDLVRSSARRLLKGYNSGRSNHGSPCSHAFNPTSNLISAIPGVLIGRHLYFVSQWYLLSTITLVGQRYALSSTEISLFVNNSLYLSTLRFSIAT